jgi:hypothetical protein
LKRHAREARGNFQLVLILVFAFALVATPMFMLVLVFIPPTTAPGLSGEPIPSIGRVRPIWLVHPVARPMNANLPTAVVAAPLAADQRGVFKGGSGR